MTKNSSNDVRQLKRSVRAEAAARRDALADGEELSRRIFHHLAGLPAYLAAKTVMFYLDTRSEVRTRWFVPQVWQQGKRVVVPYCLADELGLFRLEHFDELAPGAMGILEPRPELRDRTDRKIAPAQLDFIVVPGVAFDRRGGRLGFGKGYYDRLLCQIRNDAVKAAVCFECQVFPEIPLSPHDVRMDMIVTERGVYPSGSSSEVLRE